MLRNQSARLVRRTCPVACGLLAAALSGCGITPQPLPVRDDEAEVVAARVAVRPAAWSRGGSSRPGLEIGYERYRAADTRALASGDALDLGNQIVTGPTTIAQKATLQVAHFVYSHRFHFGPNFELEPFGGLSRVEMRYEAQPAAGPAGVMQEKRRAVYGGITPRWRFNDWSAIELRIAGIDSATISGRSAELALVLSPAPALALRLGYADRHHEAELFGPGAVSKVDVRARGPLASVLLTF